MEGHLDNKERSKGNKRNGKGKKTIKSGFGTFDIETPASASLQLVPFRATKEQERINKYYQG